MLAFVLLVAALDVRPLDLGSMSIDRARTLDGQRVAVTFIVAKPVYTLNGFTIVGAADRDDGAERVAVLVGRRLDVKEGGRIVVAGRLRVIRHRGDGVAGVVVPAWDEIRVSE
ncbi:hypothetical protein [Gemmata sp.]|uniref:hypothetical protein n=1 Tax=Gemmata sp. TaxID=1914242 RepID=UPI003F6ECD18